MNKLNYQEGLKPYDKVYIGNIEAWEFCLSNGIEKLPRKGKQIVCVKSIAENIALGKEYTEAIGKDENGFFLMFI